MEKKNEFLIPVSGLALGSHSYQFEINDDFFADKEYSEIQQGKVSVSLDINRQETLLTLRFGIKGTVRVTCDRCADEFDQPIEDEREFFIKLGIENAEEADDVAVVEPDAHDFDVNTLGFSVIRENYRPEKRDWKLDLRLGESTELELFAPENPPKRPNWPEACGLRHLPLQRRSARGSNPLATATVARVFRLGR